MVGLSFEEKRGVGSSSSTFMVGNIRVVRWLLLRSVFHRARCRSGVRHCPLGCVVVGQPSGRSGLCVEGLSVKTGVLSHSWKQTQPCPSSVACALLWQCKELARAADLAFHPGRPPSAPRSCLAFALLLAGMKSAPAFTLCRLEGRRLLLAELGAERRARRAISVGASRPGRHRALSLVTLDLSWLLPSMDLEAVRA